MRISAALRVTIVCSTIFVLPALVSGLAVFQITHHALERELDNRIASEMNALINEYAREGDEELLTVIRGRQTSDVAGGLTYGLFAPDGHKIAGDMKAGRPDQGWQLLALPDRYNTMEQQRALAIDISPRLRLVVAGDNESLERVESSMGLALGSELLLMIVMGVLCAFGSARYLRRRLAGMVSAAHAITAGDLGQRVPVGNSGDEFDSLAALLNAMLDRVAALLDRLRQVSEDVAHDLRTPLNRLRNQLERALSDGNHEEAMLGAIEQADSLLDLFTSMLRLAEIEAGRLRATFTAIDLATLVQEVGDSYSPAIEDGGRTLRCHIADVPAIRGDRELLTQALMNLLDNAQVHTAAGTRIYLSVGSAMGGVKLSVADNGPGVLPDDRERITDRFTRLEASRHLPGHGLGLSLVAAIAKIHGAALAFGDNRPGLIVSIEFPRA